MSMLGIGAMLHILGGGSERNPADYYGQTILAAKLADDRLTLDLANGKSIQIWDDGQSCCEWRHMTTDDDPSSLVGGRLARIEVRDAPDESDEDGDVHEICFVEVATDQTHITLVNHNEHNGYYGGFGLTVTEVPAHDR